MCYCFANVRENTASYRETVNRIFAPTSNENEQ